MHIRDLYNDPILMAFFGSSRVIDLGRRFRENLPDFPGGKGEQGEIGVYHAVWFLFVLARVKSVNDKREVYNAIGALTSTIEESSKKDPILVVLGNLLGNPDEVESVEQIWISKVYDFVKIFYTDREPRIFRGSNVNEAISTYIEEVTILKHPFLLDFSKRWQTKD